MWPGILHVDWNISTMTKWVVICCYFEEECMNPSGCRGKHGVTVMLSTLFGKLLDGLLCKILHKQSWSPEDGQWVNFDFMTFYIAPS